MVDELIKYLLQNFGLETSVYQLNNPGGIPLYLQANFELFEGHLMGQKVVWAKLRDNQDFTPDQLQKQGQQLKQILNAPVIFVFDKLESWHRKRLIEKQVSFVQPSKQLYIPELFLQLNDIIRHPSGSEKNADKLTPPAQLAILYHLQVNSLEGKLFMEIAELLHYSAMTITRVVKELQGYRLVMIEGAKEKSIRFNVQGRELWERSYSFMSSPVMEKWFTDHFVRDPHFRNSGDNALSAYTMIADSGQPTYAIGKEEFRSLKTQGTLQQLDKINGTATIEVWMYNPMILSSMQEVDRLSLYLSLKDEEDERVQAAREELLNQMSW